MPDQPNTTAPAAQPAPPVSAEAEEAAAIDNLRKKKGLETMAELEARTESGSEKELEIMVNKEGEIEIGGLKMKVYPLSIRKFRLFTKKLRSLSENERLKDGMSEGSQVSAQDIGFMEALMDVALDELIELIAIIIPDIKKLKSEEVEDAITIPKMIEIVEYVKALNHWPWLKKNLLQDLLPRVAGFIGEISSKLSQTKKAGK